MANPDKPNEAEMPLESSGLQDPLSPPEYAVLAVFRKYLMSPGKMLCFTNLQLSALREPLAQLLGKGLLVQENFPGAYSLTETGFNAMRDEN